MVGGKNMSMSLEEQKAKRKCFTEIIHNEEYLKYISKIVNEKSYNKYKIGTEAYEKWKEVGGNILYLLDELDKFSQIAMLESLLWQTLMLKLERLKTCQ